MTICPSLRASSVWIPSTIRRGGSAPVRASPGTRSGDAPRWSAPLLGRRFCGMGSVLTSGGTAARRARQSVELTRAQVLGIAVLVVVPLPALSLGALVVPLPQLMERAAAGFIPFGSPEIEAPPPRTLDRART